MNVVKLLAIVRANRDAGQREPEDAIAIATGLVLLWNQLPAETRGSICNMLRAHILDPDAIILHGLQIRIPYAFDDNSWA